jgi:hypothetical protein
MSLVSCSASVCEIARNPDHIVTIDDTGTLQNRALRGDSEW